MASNHPSRFALRFVRFLLVAALGFPSIAFADEAVPANPAAPPSTATSADTGEKSFYYEYDDKGELVFTQILSWQGDPNALSYEVEVRNAAGKTVLERATEETRVEVSLAAGEYEYRVGAVNLLGKRERVGSWLPFTVKKAVKPEVDWVSPDDIYLEDGGFVVTVGGSGFADGLRVSLVESGDADESGTTDEADDGPWGEVSESSRERITVSFPPDSLEAGVFRVLVVNPSGLSGLSRERLTVGYREQNGYYASAGYSPFVAVLDPWFTDLWREAVYPAGFILRGGAYIARRKSSRFGFEARLSGRFTTAERDSVVIDMTVFQAGLSFVYKQEFGERFALVARLGAGMAATEIALDLNGIAGETAGSFDPAAYLGLAAQYTLSDRLYAEAGADFEVVFYEGFVSGGFTPTLALGYRFKP